MFLLKDAHVFPKRCSCFTELLLIFFKNMLMFSVHHTSKKRTPSSAHAKDGVFLSISVIKIFLFMRFYNLSRI